MKSERVSSVFRGMDVGRPCRQEDPHRVALASKKPQIWIGIFRGGGCPMQAVRNHHLSRVVSLQFSSNLKAAGRTQNGWRPGKAREKERLS